MQIHDFLRGLFSSFTHSSAGRGAKRRSQPVDGEEASVSAHKLSLDFAFRDLRLSLSRAGLKAFLKRSGDSVSASGKNDSLPALEISPGATPENTLPAEDAQSAFDRLASRFNRLYGEIRDVLGRLQQLEERLTSLAPRAASSETKVFPRLQSDPAVLMESTLTPSTFSFFANRTNESDWALPRYAPLEEEERYSAPRFHRVA